MGMKVFGPVGSPNVARVVVCLEEVGAEYEVVPINFATGEHNSPAHVARNPFGQIPAFQDDDFTIFESRAISRYILHKYKSDLLPRDDLKKATLVDIWLDAESTQYSTPISTIVFNVIFKKMFGGTCDQQAVDENLEKLKKILEVYEARLSQCKYLAGDFISLADLSHFPSTHYLMGTQYASLFDSYSHVKAWWMTMTSRPAIKKVIELMSQK